MQVKWLTTAYSVLKNTTKTISKPTINMNFTNQATKAPVN
jgi:hypothetical protein